MREVGILVLIYKEVAQFASHRSGALGIAQEVETIVADYIKANPQIIPEALSAQRDREMAKAIDAIRPALE